MPSIRTCSSTIRPIRCLQSLKYGCTGPSRQTASNGGLRRRCTLVLRPILADLWDKEFKVAASPRIKLRFIERAEAQGSLFLAARFGLYSSGEYYESLRKNFHGETLVYDAAFRATGWPGDFQSLLGLTAFFRRPTRQHIHSHAFFLLSPEDPFHVVDYWNLRASGTYLFPLNLQDYQECAKGNRDFGSASAYPINETVTNHPTIINSARGGCSRHRACGK